MSLIKWTKNRNRNVIPRQETENGTTSTWWKNEVRNCKNSIYDIKKTKILFISIQSSLKKGKAGLSRATLEIPSEFSSNFSLRTHKSRSIQWLHGYSTFNILRSFSIGGCLHFEDLKIGFAYLSLGLKFEYDQISGCWDIPLLIFWGRLPVGVNFHWRSSSFWGFKNYG